LTNSSKLKLKNLSLTYTSNLTSLNGIDKFENLEHLSLFASTPESNKKVNLDNLLGIEKLTNLKSLNISYFRFNIEQLKEKLLALTELKQFKIDNTTYENK
jgi:hypothetical protein